MKRIIKKVDGVISIDEALELQNLGVDIIGVSLSDGITNLDRRVLNLESILKIRDVLQIAKIAIEIPSNFTDVISLVNKVKTDYVQVLGNRLLPIELRKQLKQKGVGIIYSGIEASYEDDPSWIMSAYKDIEELNDAFYQVNLLGDIEDSWFFFKTESPNYLDELQISDIIDIGKNFPLILSLNFNRDNICDIINAFPSMKGISLSVGKKSNKEYTHYFDYQLVLDILKYINNNIE